MKHIIIGAGILGASTALHLVEKGEEVVIIDRFEPGQATRNAAGIICPWLTNRSNKDWYELVIRGAAYYEPLVERLVEYGERETGYRKTGAINLFDTDEKLDRKYDLAVERRREATAMGELSKLTTKETREMFPLVSESYRALHISGAARVNGDKVAQAMLNASVKLGAAYIKGDARLLMHSGNVEGVEVNGRTINADRYLLTSGAWMNQLFQDVGLKSNVHFEKAQILHFEMPEFATENWPVVLPPFNHYILSFDKGKIVVGATKEKRSDFNVDVTAGAVHQLLDKALRVAPGLAEAAHVETKVGFRPFTKGNTPVLGNVPGIENLIVANGLGASGLTSGPYVGLQLANLASGNTVDLPLENYPPSSLFL
ncbi:UNVERIFIED_CONTAM: FAD-binding oxidoreductase [Halobacillus marinus]